MSKKTFTLSEPVTVGQKTYTKVTMRSFKGSAVAAFIARRAEIAEMGNERAPFLLCELSSGEPMQLFEDMELDDYLPILEHMTPHFQKMMAAMGNVAKGKESTPPTNSN